MWLRRAAELGGLGVLDLQRFNNALRLRWIGKRRLGRINHGRGLLEPASTTNQALFAYRTEVTFGNGKTASFWTVAEAICNDHWLLDLRGRVSPGLLPDFVMLREVARSCTLAPDTEDAFRWRSPSGAYSATSAYALQFDGTEQSSLRHILPVWAPPKCKFFVWLLLQPSDLHRR
ncbi:uncharacterized protein [Lolium perenne]|uniref:uncharacterized protein n=1 Tax=Lolium perenne TaxID=4522 RepID=UPI0021F5123D|nr:uncharacterized protein LOC127310757 [Lolium perenne]